MDVGILGTGNLAVALGRSWAGAGHSVTVVGRSARHAADAADRIGHGARAVHTDELAAGSDVVVVAVAWDGLEDALALVGGPAGALAGTPVVDCTNAVDYGTGELRTQAGSAAELVARSAPGAHVVKALHLFAGASWPYDGPEELAPVVALCGDDPHACELVGDLIRSLGAKAAVVGPLSSARQLEEAAGFVMRVVAAGHNPRLAVPDVPTPGEGTAA